MTSRRNQSTGGGKHHEGERDRDSPRAERTGRNRDSKRDDEGPPSPDAATSSRSGGRSVPPAPAAAAAPPVPLPATFIGRVVHDLLTIPLDKMIVPLLMTLCFVVGYNSIHSANDKVAALELRIQHLAPREAVSALHVHTRPCRSHPAAPLSSLCPSAQQPPPHPPPHTHTPHPRPHLDLPHTTGSGRASSISCRTRQWPHCTIWSIAPSHWCAISSKNLRHSCVRNVCVDCTALSCTALATGTHTTPTPVQLCN
jgi:hypothetical protein